MEKGNEANWMKIRKREGFFLFIFYCGYNQRQFVVVFENKPPLPTYLFLLDYGKVKKERF